MRKSSTLNSGLLFLCIVVAGTATTLAMAGCGSSGSGGGGTTPPTGQVNQYLGTSNPVSTGPSYTDGGVWGATLDTVTEFFKYRDVDQFGGNNATSYLSGNSASSPYGITILTIYQLTNGSGGYVVELPGEGLLLRTGNSHSDAFGGNLSALIGAAASNTCPAFTSAQNFNFIAEGSTFAGDPAAHAAYGSVEIAPGSGDTWTFSNLKMFTLAGTPLSPTPFPNGTCPPTPAGFVIVSPLPNSGNSAGATQITTAISPSGLLVLDQGQNNGLQARFDGEAPTPTTPLGLLGVLQPSSPLKVSDMVSKTYAGFESEPLSRLGTVAVAFGSAPGTDTAIIGGPFPGDDVTQQPATDTTLDLGTESTQTPGLFTSVTLTRPDYYAACAGTPSGGTDPQGNPTCIFHGAAVAGQVAGKYVIFTNINDPTAALLQGKATPLAVVNLVLYQQ